MMDDATRLGDDASDRRRQWVRNRPVRVSILTRGLFGLVTAAAIAMALLLAPLDSGSGLSEGSAELRLAGNGTLVSVLAFAPDERTLAVGYTGGELRIWELSTLSSRAVSASRFTVSSVAYAPDGRSIAAVDHGPEIRRFDSATLDPLPSLEAPEFAFTVVGFSHDGRTLAAGDRSGRVALWSVAEGRIQAVLEGHRGMISAIMFSHDDRTLATGGGIDGTIRLWDAECGRPAKVLAGHPSIVQQGVMSRVVSLAFSPDDRTLVSGGGFDPHLRRWDVRSGRPLEVWGLEPSGCNVTYVAFTGDLAIPERIKPTADAMLHHWETAEGPTVLAGVCLHSMRMAVAPARRTVAVSKCSDVQLWSLAPSPGHASDAGSQAKADPPATRRLAVGRPAGGLPGEASATGPAHDSKASRTGPAAQGGARDS
jgi:hypothetical protein